MIDHAARSPILALLLSFLTLGSAPAFAADGDGAPAPSPSPTLSPPAPPVVPVVPAASAPQALCRAPQAARGKGLYIDSPQAQADAWAKWMTEQIAAGRSNFILAPPKAVEKDEDGSDGPPDSFSQVLCAW